MLQCGPYTSDVPQIPDPIESMAAHWREHGIPGVDQMVAMTTVLRAQQLIVARISDALKPLGLSFSRYEALTLLHFSPDGTLPLAQTSERLMLHPSSVTGTIDRLEREGLVERRPHSTDRRVTLAKITPAGAELIERAIKVVVSVDYGLEGMSDVDIERITTILSNLRWAAADYQRGAEPVRT